MKIIIKKLFWYSLPFILFLIGFIFAFFFFPRRFVVVSSFIGKKSELAFTELSQVGLTGRCTLATVENPSLVGVVIDQLPEVGAQVYRGHAVQLTVGQQSLARVIPDFIGQPANTVKSLAKEYGYEVTLVWVHHYRSMGTCFAQTPQSNALMSHAKIICYCSLGQAPYGIMPTLVGASRKEVEHFAEANNVSIQCIADKKKKDLSTKGDLVVVDQQPAPGVIIDGSKQLFVQVQLAESDV